MSAVVLRGAAAIPLDALSSDDRRRLEVALSVPNPARIQAERLGDANAWRHPARVGLLAEVDGHAIVPIVRRDLWAPFARRVGVEDERPVFDAAPLPFRGELFDFQERAVSALAAAPYGGLVAPPGAGKGEKIAAIAGRTGLPTLVVVGQLDLAEDLANRLPARLGVTVGRIGAGTFDVQRITVATAQSLTPDVLPRIRDAFGVLVVDEAHHAAAPSYLAISSSLSVRRRYWFTATPRSDGLEPNGEPSEQCWQDATQASRVALEQDHGEHPCGGEERALLRHPWVCHAVLSRGGRHQGARDRRVEQEREHLLSDAFGALGVELVVADVVALLEPVEELDLPAPLVQGADRFARELTPWEAREQDAELPLWTDAADGAQRLAADLARASARRRRECDVGIDPTRPRELFNGEVAAFGRHAHHEVHALFEEQVEHDVAWVATIEHEDVAFTCAREQATELCALIRRVGGDHGVHGQLRDDVEEHGDQDLRHEPTRMAAELSPQLRGTLQVHLAAVDRQHAPPLKSMCGAVHSIELGGRIEQDLTHGRGADSFSSVAEGSRRDRIRSRKRDATRLGFVPERIEHLLVASTSAVAGHVDQERDEQLG